MAKTRTDAAAEITELESQVTGADSDLARLDADLARDVSNRTVLEEEIRRSAQRIGRSVGFDKRGRPVEPTAQQQAQLEELEGLRAQVEDLNEAISKNRREHRLVKRNRAEAKKALRPLMRAQEAKKAAVPTAPLKAQVEEAKAKLDDLRSKGDDLRATIRAESALGGDPLKLVQTHRELQELPTVIAFAERGFYMARQHLLEVEVAHRAVQVEEARQRMEAGRPAYEQALADWHALEQDLIEASNQHRVMLSTLSTVRAQVGRSERDLSP